MPHPRLVAVVAGLVLLAVPIGVGLHQRLDEPAGAPTTAGDTAVLSAATPARNTYREWGSAKGFAAGTFEGTRLAGSKVVVTRTVGRTTIGRTSYAISRWTSPWVTPGHAFTELIPSWHVSTPPGSLVQIQVRARTTGGVQSSYDKIGTWTTRDAEFRRTSYDAQPDDVAHVSTDTFIADPGKQFRSWQIRILLLRSGGPGPTVSTLGAVVSQLPSARPATSKRLYGARTLAVPAYSQMIHRGEYPQYGGGGEAWCSPTSTAMIMAYYKALPNPANYAWVKKSYPDRWVDHVARLTYDFGYRGTGNWPFNAAVANQYVSDAFVTRLTSLRDAERFIHAGIPLAASISFSRGQLSGAPISASNGHLVVISGFTAAGNVVVNDPAAASDRSVRRTYNRAQFERAWLGKSAGLVYVIHDAAHPLPARPAGSTAW